MICVVFIQTLTCPRLMGWSVYPDIRTQLAPVLLRKKRLPGEISGSEVGAPTIVSMRYSVIFRSHFSIPFFRFNGPYVRVGSSRFHRSWGGPFLILACGLFTI